MSVALYHGGFLKPVLWSSWVSMSLNPPTLLMAPISRPHTACPLNAMFLPKIGGWEAPASFGQPGAAGSWLGVG